MIAGHNEYGDRDSETVAVHMNAVHAFALSSPALAALPGPVMIGRIVVLSRALIRRARQA
ncbi:hypothetical protein [Caenispirillum salinarum]|uniref:hypothetical protein n=1 Tax=Caenispirillum salinarum TaxID=859058 RepID=UPI00384AD2E1